MDWTISTQALAAYKRSADDAAVRKAYDALWARLQLDPAEGSDFAACVPDRAWISRGCGGR